MLHKSVGTLSSETHEKEKFIIVFESGKYIIFWGTQTVGMELKQ
jgi:hypothetical protein